MGLLITINIVSLESSKQQIAKETIENETQTIEIDADNEIEESFNCKTCEFEADDIYDLDAHWFSTKCGDSLIACHFCEMNFQTKSDLMKHRKHNHPEKVNICQNFLGVGCNLGEDACWFSHKTTTINKDTYMSNFKCTDCDKHFGNKFEFMHHRKQDHQESVPLCKKGTYGTCWFGPKNCWFTHDEKQTSIENDSDEKNGDEIDHPKKEKEKEKIHYNQEVFEKLFGMIEKITERIIIMENVI